MTSNLSSPDRVFEAGVAALDAEDWALLASLCDAASLRLFRAYAVLQYSEPRRLLTLEQYLEHAPSVTREEAERHLAAMEQSADPVVRLREDYPSLKSVEQLMSLSPLDLFAAWLQARSPRAQYNLAQDHGMARVSAGEEDQLPWSWHRPMIIGVLSDGDRVAHVIWRFAGVVEPDPSIADAEERSLQIDIGAKNHVNSTLCRRQDSGDWLLVADHNLLGLGFATYFVSDHWVSE